MRRLVDYAFTLVVGMTLFVGVAELATRVLHRTPRVQIVRGRAPGRPGYDIVMKGGEPTWAEQGTEERHNERCTGPDTVDVAMFGSSIFYGTSYEPEQVMSAALQRRLDAQAPGRWCIHNYGQPAYAGRNKWAEASEVLPRLKPEIVLWELWDNDPGRYTFIGIDAYNFVGLRINADGLPWVLPLPDAAHRWLFETSRFYSYATMALSPMDPRGESGVWNDYFEWFEPSVEALVKDAGASLVFVVPTPLDQPFSTYANRRSPYRERFAAWAAEHDIPMIYLAQALEGQDVTALRHDPCCHFNPAGHAAVADVLLPVLETTAAKRATP